MIRAFLVIQAAFSAWMFFDALQRRAETFWFFVIWLPFGEVIYFFMVKIHDPELYHIKRSLQAIKPAKKVSVDQLRYQFRQTPSFANMVQLAQALHDSGEYLEACELFSQALKLDDEAKDARFGLALSQTNLEQYEPAVEHLRKLIAADAQYQGFLPWSSLAYALWMDGRHDQALETLAELVRSSPRMAHRLLWAEYLIEAGRFEQAEEQLHIAIEDYSHAPTFQKRKDRPWHGKAKKMLKQLAARQRVQNS